MHVSVIGTGYVGSVTGAGLAELGNIVTFVDIDQEKLAQIRCGKAPIIEPGLEEIIRKNIAHIKTTTSIDIAVNETDVTFICVGTPSNSNGSIDLRYIKSVSEQLGQTLKNKKKYHTVIVKSSILPSTTDTIVIPLIEKKSGKRAGESFGICSNPEFLREGSAVFDFFHPERIIVGCHDEKTRRQIKKLYSSFACTKMFTDIRTAEMIKYASNAFLATKVSFANEIGNICKKLCIDSYEVFKGVGMDNRINPHFLRSGVGFGGSCFPKDVNALIRQAQDLGEKPRILSSVITTNDRQPEKMYSLLKKHVSVKGKTIGLLGLSFKPGTDDIRESRAIPLIKKLQKAGANIVAYDPVAMTNLQELIPDIRYAESPVSVLQSDAILIITEWEEFEHLDYSGKIVIDGRRVEKARNEAKVYEGVCW